MQRELRENAEIEATEMEGPRKRAKDSASKSNKRESPNAGLQLNRQRSTATVLADGHAAQEQMLDFLKEQSSGESEFRKSYLQGLDADRQLRTQQMLLEQMSPESKKVWVREESQRLQQQRQKQEELELINALTPKSKNKALLDRLNRNKA